MIGVWLMRQWLTAIKAFWIRDAINAISYRLNFAFQLASLFWGLIAFYFFSKLVGNQAPVSRYGGYLPFTVIGTVMTTFFLTGFSCFSNAVQSERATGTLEYVLLTPTKVHKVIISSSAWEFCWCTISALVVFTTAKLFFGITLQGNFFLAFLVLALTTVCFSCVGILSASFVMVFRRGDPLKFFIGIITYTLGGVTFPTTLFPPWMQKISNLLPVTHGLNALREILLLGKSFSDILPQILILIAFNAVFLPLSLCLFRFSVDIARREGSLLHY
jgi:ABC-2 type transport system permease protein